MAAILLVDGSDVLVVVVVVPVVCYIATDVVAVSIVILFILAIVAPWKTPFPLLFQLLALTVTLLLQTPCQTG